MGKMTKEEFREVTESVVGSVIGQKPPDLLGDPDQGQASVWLSVTGFWARSKQLHLAGVIKRLGMWSGN